MTQSLFRTLAAIGAIWLFGLALAFFFAWNALDESFDLWALFRLRGIRPVPAQTVVVGLDQASIARAGYAIAAPREWPRSRHAALIDELKRRGASVVVFDFEFLKWKGDADDQQLAASIAQAGNVVLAAGLEQDVSVRDDSRQLTERLRTLPAEFQRGAAAVAPFVLPRRPPRVNGYDTFRRSAGDAPALPVVVFRLFSDAEHALLLQLVQRANAQAAQSLAMARTGAGKEDEVAALRRLFSSDPKLALRVRELLDATHLAEIDERQRRVLHTLLELYSGDAYRYLQFYGPPGTVPVVPYDQAFTAQPGRGELDWRGKVVFVGWLRQQEKDTYYTPFSSDEGDDLTGVEIAATAFANLAQHKPIRPVQAWHSVALLLACAVVLGILCMNVPAFWMAPVTLALMLAYGALALRQFDVHGVWLPLLAPLAAQAPFAVACAWWRRTRELHRVADALGRVMQNRLPRDVAQRIARNLSPELSAQAPEQWLMYGTCLHTDVAGYTRIAHSLNPEELYRVMQGYFRELEQIVTHHGGFVVDRAGDSMLALWAAAAPDRLQRAAACRAALAIARATTSMDPEKRRPTLPTRIGLDAGQIALGFVGVDMHEFRAFGDIVNASQRVEEKNKQLHTWVLATSAVIDGVDEFLTRPIGDFQLRGRDVQTEVVELMCETSTASAEQIRLAKQFTQALQSYRSAPREAHALLTEILQAVPGDGPTQYYLEQLWEHVN